MAGRTTYREDPETGKFIELSEWYAKFGGDVEVDAPMLQAGFEAFKSPIDGKIISDRKQLADHNKRNGVTNIADYGEKHFTDAGRRMHNERIGNTPQAERERRQLITRELNRRGMK